jgi:hypothetical protein
MNEYEITLEYVGNRKQPKYIETEYGFGINPPIVVRAKNKTEAIKQLRLPKTVRIEKITKSD